MKRIIALSALIALSFTSCSTEDAIAEQETQYTKANQLAEGLKAGCKNANRISQIDYAEVWRGMDLNIDFTYFFDYTDTNELKELSNKTFKSAIEEMRMGVSEKEGISDMATTIVFENGKARVQKHLFIDSSNVIQEAIEYKNGETIERQGNEELYRMPLQYNTVCKDAENNIEAIGEYLAQNLTTPTNKVVLEVKVNDSQAVVYAKI